MNLVLSKDTNTTSYESCFTQGYQYKCRILMVGKAKGINIIKVETRNRAILGM